MIVKTDGSFAALPCILYTALFQWKCRNSIEFHFCNWSKKESPPGTKVWRFFVNQQNIPPVFLTSFMQKVLKGFKIIISLQTGLVVTFQSTKGLWQSPWLESNNNGGSVVCVFCKIIKVRNRIAYPVQVHLSEMGSICQEQINKYILDHTSPGKTINIGNPLEHQMF